MTCARSVAASSDACKRGVDNEPGPRRAAVIAGVPRPLSRRPPEVLANAPVDGHAGCCRARPQPREWMDCGASNDVDAMGADATPPSFLSPSLMAAVGVQKGAERLWCDCLNYR